MSTDLHFCTVAPPYSTPCEPVRSPAGLPRHPGAVLVAEVTTGWSPAALKSLVGLRVSAPWAPVVIRAGTGWKETGSSGSILTLLAATVQSRCVIAGAGNVGVQLEGLSNGSALPRQVIGWLNLLNRRVTPAVRVLVEATVGELPETPRFDLPSNADVLRRARVSRSTANRELRRAGLRSVAVWRRVGSLVHGVLMLQRDPTLTVERAAWHCGYSGAAAFSRACRSHFQITPSVARAARGWEWLVWKACLLTRPSRPGSDARARRSG
jgi:AraC-like DNA-binding protein